jgi:hypothetical protein
MRRMVKENLLKFDGRPRTLQKLWLKAIRCGDLLEIRECLNIAIDHDVDRAHACQHRMERNP